MVRPLHILQIHDNSKGQPNHNPDMKRITSGMLLFLVCAFCGCHTPHERGVEYKVVTLHGKQGPPEPELNRLAKCF